MNNPPRLAFTSRFKGLVQKIITPAWVSIPAIIPEVDHEQIEVAALWDTGATNSVISARLANSLNLSPTGRIQVRGVNEIKEVNTYIIDIHLPNKLTIQNVTVSEAKEFSGDFDLLIGMDIICLGDFAITNLNKTTTFSFHFPSFREIDFVPEADAYHRKLQREKDRNKRKSQRKKKSKRR